MEHRRLTDEDKDRLASVGYNRPGYKNSTREIVKDDRGSRQVEHFDGRVDAEIRPKAIKVKAQTKE